MGERENQMQKGMVSHLVKLLMANELIHVPLHLLVKIDGALPNALRVLLLQILDSGDAVLQHAHLLFPTKD